jgi:hypothetical protein
MHPFQCRCRSSCIPNIAAAAVACLPLLLQPQNPCLCSVLLAANALQLTGERCLTPCHAAHNTRSLLREQCIVAMRGILQ